MTSAFFYFSLLILPEADFLTLESLDHLFYWSLATDHYFLLYPYLASKMGAVRLSTGT